MTITLDNHDIAVSSISFILGALVSVILFIKDEKPTTLEESTFKHTPAHPEIKWTSYSSGPTYKCENCKDTGRVLDVDGTTSCKSCKRSSE